MSGLLSQIASALLMLLDNHFQVGKYCEHRGSPFCNKCYENILAEMDATSQTAALPTPEPQLPPQVARRLQISEEAKKPISTSQQRLPASDQFTDLLDTIKKLEDNDETITELNFNNRYAEKVSCSLLSFQEKEFLQKLSLSWPTPFLNVFTCVHFLSFAAILKMTLH